MQFTTFEVKSNRVRRPVKRDHRQGGKREIGRQKTGTGQN
jgi:hypothetical protein